MTTQVAHFNVEGKWFTWMLRHLWVEGNEVKAIKMWFEAFPDHSSLKSLNEYFIPIVTGKKKFTGWASPGFGIANDKRKCWDPDQSGKDNKHFPLLKSWQDVILLKKTKMYVSELHLRAFILSRQSCSTFTGNSLEWLKSVDENKIENSIRKEVNKYWMDIRNISNQFATEVSLEILPTDNIPLKEGPTFKDKRNIKSLKECYSVYEQVLSYLMPIKVHFDKEYGVDCVRVFSDSEIRMLCGIDGDDDRLLKEVNDLPFCIPNPRPRIEQIEQISANAIAGTAYAINSLMGLDVEKYVKGMIKDGNRTSIEPEDPKKTEWNSGYIDPEGRFYGCSDLNHVSFSETLCEKFVLKKKVNSDSSDVDGQIVLDNKGWVKVSISRFFWKSKKITEEQKVAIHDYMAGKNMHKALFNTSLENYSKTFREEFEE